MTENIILIAALVLIIGGAVVYIIHEKKRGRKCIGCPYSSDCGKSGASCTCGTSEKQ